MITIPSNKLRYEKIKRGRHPFDGSHTITHAARPRHDLTPADLGRGIILLYNLSCCLTEMTGITLILIFFY